MWFLVAWLSGCGTKDSGSPAGGSALCNVDADGDGFGSSTAVPATSCTDEGVADNADDCDDEAASIHPGATETAADGIDQDCDGNDLCYEDLDRDGYGGVPRPLRDCAAEGIVGRDGDCNEGDAAVHPGAPEVPVDGVDQDCDGGDACFADMDGDGFGTVTTVVSADLDCKDPGESNGDDDCLDSGADAAATFPGAAPSDSGTECMTDADDDGYGSATPAAGVASGSDHCDDDGTTICIVHVGYDDEFPEASYVAPDTIIGCRLDVDAPMTVAGFALIAKASGPNVRMALYTDRLKLPDVLVLEGPSTPVVVGVLEMSVDPTPIDVGHYWIMAVYDGESWMGTKFDPPSGNCEFADFSFSEPMPDPFGPAWPVGPAILNYYIVGY